MCEWEVTVCSHPENKVHRPRHSQTRPKTTHGGMRANRMKTTTCTYLYTDLPSSPHVGGLPLPAKTLLALAKFLFCPPSNVLTTVAHKVRLSLLPYLTLCCLIRAYLP